MENIWSYISKLLVGENTEAEYEIVVSWLNKNNTNRKIYDQIKEIWSSDISRSPEPMAL